MSNVRALREIDSGSFKGVRKGYDKGFLKDVV